MINQRKYETQESFFINKKIYFSQTKKKKMNNPKFYLSMMYGHIFIVTNLNSMFDFINLS